MHHVYHVFTYVSYMITEIFEFFSSFFLFFLARINLTPNLFKLAKQTFVLSQLDMTAKIFCAIVAVLFESLYNDDVHFGNI